MDAGRSMDVPASLGNLRAAPAPSGGTIGSASVELLRYVGAMIQARCPICDAAVVAEHKPFCSKRCKTIDLGSWLDGAYSIPAVEPPSPEELSPEELEVLFGKAEA